MIKAVIFDYFGVIAADSYWDEVHDKVAHTSKEGQISRLVSEMDDGHIAWSAFCEEAAQVIGTTAQEVDKHCHELRLNKWLITYANQLKKRIQKIALISNASSEYLSPILESSGLSVLFDVVVVSSDVGQSKPHPAIYKKALQQLKIEPFESIMIDDSLSNISGAENVGMYGVLFESNQQIKKRVETLLADTNN